MFVNNLNPTIIDFGFLEIRWYGLVYLLGFILTFFFLIHNRKKLNLNKEEVSDFLVYLFAGLLIGGRLLHFAISDPSTIFRNPLEFFMIWHGGISFFGSMLGLIAGTAYYCKIKKKDWWKIADVAAIPAIIGLVFGRIANFVNSELVGRVAENIPWCVQFLRYPVDNLCRHPYQLYASFSHIILLGILLFLTKKKYKKGTVFFGFIIGYSALRFITDFWRQEQSLWLLGLTSWQWISLLAIGCTVGFIMLIKKNH